MQQRERHRASSKLQMERCAVGLWTNASRRSRGIQGCRELRVRHRLDGGRIDAERPGIAVDAVYLAGADADCSGNLPVRPPEAELLAKDLSENVHG
jgi:hypothetical protein